MSLLNSSGRLGSMLKMLSAYYGSGTDGQRDETAMSESGEQGEITELHVNGVKPIINNTLAVVCGTRPGIKPVATNGDSASAAQARLALGLNDFYDRRLNTKTSEIETVRGSLIASSWSMVQTWNRSTGEPIAMEGNFPIYEGDIQVELVSPWRIAYDPTPTIETDRKWALFRTKKRRHDLAARSKNEITKRKLLEGGVRGGDELPHLAKMMSTTEVTATSRMTAIMGETINLEDEVWVWELRHLDTPALPGGRMVMFVEPDIVLYDSFYGGEPPEGAETADIEVEQLRGTRVGYPYEELHAYEYAVERIVGTTQGHTMSFSMLGLQDFIDVCTTSMATTVNLMGLPHVWSPAGQAPNMRRTSTGINVMETPQRPELIDFPALKPELVEAAKWAQQLMAQMAALNDTVMGNPQKGMPASAQALQRAQAVQYHQVSQDEWVRLVEKNANGRLRMLKRFARTERVAEIAGASGAWELKQWSQKDIAGVERFQVEPINPMSATFEGRQAMAEMMGVQGDALFDFLTTGSLKKVTEARTLQLELVERNKSLLQKGVPLAPPTGEEAMASGQSEFVTILRSDPHHLAIPAYLSIVNSPEARLEPQLIQNALNAVSLSLRFWSSLTLDEGAAFGIPPLPSQQMMAQVPPPQSGSIGPNQEPPAPVTPEGQAGMPGLPDAPPNPIEGTDAPENLNLAAGV